MNWNGDEPIKKETGITPDGEKLRVELNAEIVSIFTNHAAADAERAALAATSAEDFTPAHRARARDLADLNFMLMQSELRVRRRVDTEWAKARYAARVAHRAKVDRDLEQAREVVDARLVKAGYEKPEHGFPFGFYSFHPITQKATEAITQSLSINDNDDLNVNRQRIATLAGELEKLVGSAMAGA